MVNLDHEGFCIPNEAAFSFFMSAYRYACKVCLKLALLAFHSCQALHTVIKFSMLMLELGTCFSRTPFLYMLSVAVCGRMLRARYLF